MDFIEFASARYSIRNFKQIPVKQADIDQILQAALIAPTAHNLQPFKILVINSEDGMTSLKKTTKCHYGATLAFLILNDTSQCWIRKYDNKPSGDIDCAVVGTHMLLAAHSLGVGGTWVGYFMPEVVKTEFAIPAQYDPVAILVMGYPEDNAPVNPLHYQKKKLEDLVEYNVFKK